MLIGFDTSDDACAYKVSDDFAIIKTLDFFAPAVDDPFTYGQIVAANALSDVYAMGGTPIVALNIVCFPMSLPLYILREILDGGFKKVQEAGAIVAGGHSMDDVTLKYGLCVTGFIDPRKLWSNATAKEGDILILTKPLGSGITTIAAKIDEISAEDLAPSIAVMTTLNKNARDVIAEHGANACCDITGFGLIGHAREMADGCNKTIEIFAGELPIIHQALALAERGVVPGEGGRNRDFLAEKVSIAKDVPQAYQDILYDPQTSGGLLVAVPEKGAKELLAKLQDKCPDSRIIGQVQPREGVSIKVKM